MVGLVVKRERIQWLQYSEESKLKVCLGFNSRNADNEVRSQAHFSAALLNSSVRENHLGVY